MAIDPVDKVNIIHKETNNLVNNLEESYNGDSSLGKFRDVDSAALYLSEDIENVDALSAIRGVIWWLLISGAAWFLICFMMWILH